MKKIALIVLCICLCVSMLAGCAAPAGDVETSAPETSPSDTSTPQTSAPDTSLPEDTDSQQPADSQAPAAPLQWYDTLFDVPFADLSYGYSAGYTGDITDPYSSAGFFYPQAILRDGHDYGMGTIGGEIFPADVPVLASEHEVFFWEIEARSGTPLFLRRMGLDDSQPQNYWLAAPEDMQVTVEGSVLHFSDGRSFDTVALKWVEDGELKWPKSDPLSPYHMESMDEVTTDWQTRTQWIEMHEPWQQGEMWLQYEWPSDNGIEMPADTHGLQLYPHVEDVPHADLRLWYRCGSELGEGPGYSGVYAPMEVHKGEEVLDTPGEAQRRYLPVGGATASETELFVLTSDIDGGNRHLRRISLTDDHSGDYELAFEARPELFQNGNAAAEMSICPDHTEGNVLWLENLWFYGATLGTEQVQHYYFGWDTVQKVWLINGETVAPIAGVDMLSLAG